MIRIIHHLVFSNLIISLGAASLLVFAFLTKGLDFNWYKIGFIFFATLLMYNLQRIHKLNYQPMNPKNERHLWIHSNKRLIWLMMIVSGILLLLILFKLDFESILMLSMLGLISFLYSYQTKYGNLRGLPGTKIFWIAGVWSATVFVLTKSEGFQDSGDLYLFAYNFSFILSITIPFDIRDLDFDEEEYKTIPQIMGVTKARILSFVLIWVAFIFLTLLLGNFSFFLSLVYGIFSLLCLFSKPGKDELYFSGIIDFTITIATISLFLYLRIEIFHF